MAKHQITSHYNEVYAKAALSGVLCIIDIDVLAVKLEIPMKYKASKHRRTE